MLDEALRKLARGWSVVPSITLTQEPDSCGPDATQVLEIITDDAGGGPFLVLKTERWALDRDDIDALRDLFAAMLAHADSPEEHA